MSVAWWRSRFPELLKQAEIKGAGQYARAGRGFWPPDLQPDTGRQSVPLQMNESINKAEDGTLHSRIDRECAAIGPRIAVVTITTIAMALAAVIGGASAYCDSVGGTLFWVLYLTLVMPFQAMLHVPVEFAMALAGYGATVFAISRWSSFRLRFGVAVLAIVSSAIASGVITWFLTDIPGVCTVM